VVIITSRCQVPVQHLGQHWPSRCQTQQPSCDSCPAALLQRPGPSHPTLMAVCQCVMPSSCHAQQPSCPAALLQRPGPSRSMTVMPSSATASGQGRSRHVQQRCCSGRHAQQVSRPRRPARSSSAAAVAIMPSRSHVQTVQHLGQQVSCPAGVMSSSRHVQQRCCSGHRRHRGIVPSRCHVQHGPAAPAAAGWARPSEAAGRPEPRGGDARRWIYKRIMRTALRTVPVKPAIGTSSQERVHRAVNCAVACAPLFYFLIASGTSGSAKKRGWRLGSSE